MSWQKNFKKILTWAQNDKSKLSTLTHNANITICSIRGLTRYRYIQQWLYMLTEYPKIHVLQQRTVITHYRSAYSTAYLNTSTATCCHCSWSILREVVTCLWGTTIKKFLKITNWTITPVYRRISGTTWVSRYQKGKTNLDFTEARDSEWQWHQLGHMHVCTSLDR